MNREEAEEYTQGLEQSLSGSWRMFAWAQRNGIPKAMGLSTEEWVQRVGGYVKLSPPERLDAIVQLKEEGHSNRDIAKFLGVSEGTVRNAQNYASKEENTNKNNADAIPTAQNYAPDKKGIATMNEFNGCDTQKEDEPIGQRKGWRLVVPPSGSGMQMKIRLEQLVQSPLVPEPVRSEANELLASVKDDRLPNDDFDRAHELIVANRPLLTKKMIRKLEAEQDATEHAIFFACQGCENLREHTIKVNTREERDAMVIKLLSAMEVLNSVQRQLMGVNDDAQD